MDAAGFGLILPSLDSLGSARDWRRPSIGWLLRAACRGAGRHHEPSLVLLVGTDPSGGWLGGRRVFAGGGCRLALVEQREEPAFLAKLAQLIGARACGSASPAPTSARSRGTMSASTACRALEWYLRHPGDAVPMTQNLRFSLVIPVKDEAESLPALVDEIAATLSGEPFEVVVVDDGSTDATPAVLANSLTGIRSSAPACTSAVAARAPPLSPGCARPGRN